MKKKAFFLIAALTISSLLSLNVSAEDSNYKFGICVATMTNEYFVEFAEGAEDWCEEKGINCVVKDANDDISKQVTAIEDFINSGCDAIIINALDDEALRSAVSDAVGQGIPVISESVSVEGCTAAIIIDEYEYGYAVGEVAGKWAEENYGDEGMQYAILTQSTLPTTLDRSQGIFDAVSELCPSADCVIQEDAYTSDKGVTVAENILSAYPDIKMILGINDAGVLGAFEAVIASGVDENDTDHYFLGAADGDTQAVEKVQSGTIYQTTVALVGTNQEVGASAASLAYDAVSGEDVETIYLGFSAITNEGE